MSSEILHRAITQMRERAEAAQPHPAYGQWSAEGMEAAFRDAMYGDPDEPDFMRLHVDANHYAAWPPAVALAVADWLQSVHSTLHTYNANRPEVHHAFTVARAYLGEPS